MIFSWGVPLVSEWDGMGHLTKVIQALLLYLSKSNFIMKPKVFLGSSVEGLSVAYAIQTNLSHDAEITVWSQGVFELSSTTFESLLDILENVDFGIFVFTPDDVIKIRENTTSTVRDNVLFEFGLFLGKLGKQRVY